MSDGSRAKLCQDPENVYLKHPKDETVEDYLSDISETIWNDKSYEVRSNKNYVLTPDASINPLKGLLHN